MFEYLREEYDYFNKALLDSSLSVLATVYTRGDSMSETPNNLLGDTADGRYDSIKKHFPQDLKEYYRVTVYPIENTLKSNDPYRQYATSKFEPFDIWFSCFESQVKVRNSTIFDYADKVSLGGRKYSIKITYKEIFGTDPLVYVFLEKNVG